jgi:hypothetical protein
MQPGKDLVYLYELSSTNGWEQLPECDRSPTNSIVTDTSILLFIYYSYFVAILDGADYNGKQFGLTFAAKYVLMNICSDDTVNDKGIKADVSYLKIRRAQTLFVRVNGQTIG